MKMLGTSLRDLARLRDCKRKRFSSWDKTGGNQDYISIPSGESRMIADMQGAGCITHIWVTLASNLEDPEPYILRKVLLRMWWDGEPEPSVEVPIGDFFGVGHGRTVNFVSLPLTMSPQGGRGFNCFFPMPFATNARVAVMNEGDKDLQAFYYYIDYEAYETLEDDLARFHAQWNRSNPCRGIDESGMNNREFLFEGNNLTGEGNYLILQAEGKGHYVGCNLNIHNLRDKPSLEGHPLDRDGKISFSQWMEHFNWYGEGDDMIFIDGEPFPPSLHGTGTEDYFNTAYCPAEKYSAPYHGVTLPGGPNWSGQISLYRFHIEDPIMFEKSIKVSIEHGHDNRRSDDYSSTAYWYQTEPHKRFPAMPKVEDRLPREEGVQ